MQTNESILPKGTVVKVDGFPLELLADVPSRGERNEAVGAACCCAPTASTAQSGITRSSSGFEAS